MTSKNPSIFSLPATSLGVFLAVGAALATAYISEYFFGFFPCELCLWQRAPLWAALAVSMLILATGRKGGIARPLMGLLALLFVAEAGIAIFHVGVEQHMWAGTGACTSAGAGGAANDAASLRAQLMGTPVARCDQVTWTLLGFSMASWNIPFSLALMVWSFVSFLKAGRHAR